jgi:hypothetical protein
MAPSNVSLGSSSGNAAPISDNNHPTQGIFTNEQNEYLNTFLEGYLVLSSSVTGGTKSTKVKWVKSNVNQKYIEKYNSAGPNGPNILSLLMVSQFKYHDISSRLIIMYALYCQKMACFFTNQANKTSNKSTSVLLKQSAVNKPHGVTAEELFAKEYRTEL